MHIYLQALGHMYNDFTTTFCAMARYTPVHLEHHSMIRGADAYAFLLFVARLQLCHELLVAEDIMREACGLPVRVRQIQEEEGLGNVLAAGQDSAEEQEERESEWVNLRNHVTTYMLDKELDVLTYHEFKKMTFKIGEHPNLAKGDMWDQLKDKDVVRTGIIRQKTSKEKPGAFIPKMSFSRQHSDICPQPELNTIQMHFDEEQDIGLAKKYAYSCRGRSLNVETMKAFYKSMLPPPKKGRLPKEQEESMQKYQTLTRKLEDHENSLKKILTMKQG